LDHSPAGRRFSRDIQTQRASAEANRFQNAAELVGTVSISRRSRFRVTIAALERIPAYGRTWPAAFGQVSPRVSPPHSPGMKGRTESTNSKSLAVPAALPGFPGTAQIYHYGATGFFLDYAAGIRLSSEQQADLNSIKDRSVNELVAA